MLKPILALALVVVASMLTACARDPQSDMRNGYVRWSVEHSPTGKCYDVLWTWAYEGWVVGAIGSEVPCSN